MSAVIRFGYQLRPGPEHDVIGEARRAEELGFDIVLVPDHVGPGFAPMPTLAVLAAATSRIRLGTFVLNSDMRNPVQLAWEASTIDHLSGGRFELGLGAGHTPHEYAATGIERHPAPVRKAHLAERVELIRRLLDGETVDAEGETGRVGGAAVLRSKQQRLPILVGGNGDALLRHAGRHADIIGLQGLGRTLDDGHRHDVKWSPGWLDEQLGQVRAGAGGRFDQLELNALVQVVDITDDPAAATADLVERVAGLSAEHVAAIPYVLIGSVDEIASKIRRCRDRWGITYFVVRELDAFGPVMRAARDGG